MISLGNNMYSLEIALKQDCVPAYFSSDILLCTISDLTAPLHKNAYDSAREIFLKQPLIATEKGYIISGKDSTLETLPVSIDIDDNIRSILYAQYALNKDKKKESYKKNWEISEKNSYLNNIHGHINGGDILTFVYNINSKHLRIEELYCNYLANEDEKTAKKSIEKANGDMSKVVYGTKLFEHKKHIHKITAIRLPLGWD